MTEIKGMHQESERKLVESHDKLERTHTDISKQPATLKEDKQCNLSANNNPFIYSVESDSLRAKLRAKTGGKHSGTQHYSGNILYFQATGAFS